MCYKENFTQVLIEPLLKTQTYTPSYSPTHGELENLPVAPMVCVSHVFVYNAVDVNKIVAVFL